MQILAADFMNVSVEPSPLSTLAALWGWGSTVCQPRLAVHTSSSTLITDLDDGGVKVVRVPPALVGAARQGVQSRGQPRVLRDPPRPRPAALLVREAQGDELAGHCVRLNPFRGGRGGGGSSLAAVQNVHLDAGSGV